MTDITELVLQARLSGVGRRGIDNKTLSDLGWASIQQALAERCAGDAAAELALDLGFLADVASIESRRADIVALAELIAIDEPPPVRGYRDVREAVTRARKQDVLDPASLIAIRQTLEVAARVREWLGGRGSRIAGLASIAQTITPLPALANELRRAFDPYGELADSASPELGRLRRRVQSLRTGILERLERIVRSPRFEGILQDEYVTIREERYVVPVRAGERGDFPGIVHGQSNSGQTLFVEPQELITANNEFRLAQMEVENEIRRVLTALTRLVERHADAVAQNLVAMTLVDLTSAAARLTVELRMSAPRLHAPKPGAALRLHRARHPILALRGLGEGGFDVVPNDIELTPGAHLLVVSGPNTGGKTVTLKTLGLFALMTLAGLPVCVHPDSEMPLWEQVHSDIGDEQAVERDLSTFSGHVRNIVRFLPDCGDRSLVLLDELFAGTDPEQGAALGRALLGDLAARKAWVVVTTHLESLKTLAFEDARFAAASVGFDVDRLEPTYRLRMGVPGSSYALRIASRLGVPLRIVERAQGVMAEAGTATRDALVERLEREHVRFAEAQQAVENERRALELERAGVRKRTEELARRDREALDHEVRDLRRAIAEVSAALQQRLKASRDSRVDVADLDAATRQALDEARAVVRRVEARTAADKSVEPAAARGKAPKASDLVLGTEVLVVPFGKRGKVAEPPRGGERVTVQVGPMRASFNLDDLRLVEPQPARSDAPTGRAIAAGLRGDERVDEELDLRGAMVEDALERLEAFVDRAFQREAWSVRVIHGHGTGVLKRAVRARLPQLPYALRFRPGEREEGGDGVTVIQFTHAPTARPV